MEYVDQILNADGFTTTERCADLMARGDDFVALWMGVRSKLRKREEDDTIFDFLVFVVGLDSNHLVVA